MKSKIFIVIDHLGAGGTQRQVIEYLKRADRSRFDISVVNLDKGYAPVAGEIEELGYRIFHIDHSGFFNLSTLLNLMRLFKKEKPGIVHTYLFTADCYGRIAARLSGVRGIICATRAVDIWKKRHHILVDQILARFSDIITVNAEGIKPYLIETEKIDPQKITTIYNGIDLNRFKNLRDPDDVREELNIPKNALVVGMAGRFSEQKDYNTFFAAAEIVSRRLKDVYFIAVGDGPTRKTFESRYPPTSGLNLIFTGERKDAEDLINAMDVCVLSSHYEGCPNVILEYMACAKPVVASDVGGCAELVDDEKTGFIVPKSDRQVLANRMIELAMNKDLRILMGEEGRRKVKERFTSDIMAKKTEELYSRLTDPKTAFILSQFPCYDETFILREMNEIKRNGLNFVIYSIKRCRDKIVHDDAKGQMGLTRYLPLFSINIFFANIFTLICHPIKYIWTFIQVFTGNIKSMNFLLKSVGLWPQAVAFARLAKKDKITHVHGQWATFPATFAFIISRINNIGYSFTGHAHDIYLDTTMLAKKMREAEFVVTCTEDNKRYLRGIANGRIVVNHHGVDLSRFLSPQQPTTNNQQPLHILSVGSLLESKGFDVLIDACKILQDKDVNFECVIAGGGLLEKILRLKVVGCGLEGKIIFTGYITQDKLIPYYKNADIFALPVKLDIHWGLPNVLIEAQAARLPVITTALPSATELIEDGKNGFIVPERDPAALADKLLLLSKDKDLRVKMGSAGYKVVADKFDIKKNAVKFNQLFMKNKQYKIKRRSLRSFISTFFYIIGSLTRRNGMRALMYHRVNDALEPSDLVVGTETFRQQMEYLHKNGFKVINIDEMADKLKDPAYKPDGKDVMITFDDGYRDNFLNAYPVLKEYGFPAVIFLTAGMVGTDKKRPRYAGMPSPDMLSWEEVREMAKNGITFGAHTVDHPHLDRVGLEEAKKEIFGSKEIITHYLQPTTYNRMSFCYPYGDYNIKVKDIVKETIFDCAFSINPGTNAPGCDLFELKRTEMNGTDSLFDFQKKLAGAYDILHRISESRRKRLAQPSTINHRLSTIDHRPNRINVLYVIWSLGLGGAEQVVINLVKNLDKTKFNPMVCCLNDKGKFSDELEREGIKVIALNKRGKIDISIIPKLISVMKKNRIDVVNTHLWGANFWGRIAAKMAAVKVIIATEHNEDVWKTKAHYLLDRLLNRWTDKVIAVSNSVKEFYVNTAGLKADRIKVIHNGVSLSLHPTTCNLQPMRQEFGIQDNETVLALIGRLVPQKGHRYFISAFKQLSTDRKVRGLIIGSGPLETELRTYAKGIGLNENLVFTGLRKDIPDLLDVVDILVMPSLREGLPIVALEAMAKNKPVVATDVGGNPEVIIDGKTGILVSPENSIMLALAIKRLIDDKEYAARLGNNGKNRLKEYFSVGKMVKETERLYEECLSKKEIK